MGLKEKEDLEHVKRIQDLAPIEIKDEENYSKSVLKSHKTSHYNKKKNIDEVMDSVRSGQSNDLIIEMKDSVKNKELHVLKPTSENKLKTVYENKLENEKSSFFDRSNFLFQKSNILVVPADKIEENFNLNDLNSFKRSDQIFKKKIEKFYGKNEGTFRFFKKVYEEHENHRKSLTSSRNKDSYLNDNQSDISFLNTYECDSDEVRGKQDVKILNYNNNDISYNIQYNTERKKENTLIKIKPKKTKLKPSKSFSYLDNSIFKLDMNTDNRISNVSSSKGSIDKNILDNALVTYMHEVFEKKEKPRKLDSIKTTLIKNKSIKKFKIKEKFHPNLGLTLSKETTIKVIFIVLSVVIISPFVNINLYLIDSNSYMYTAFILNDYLLDNKTQEFNSFITTYIKNETNRKLYFPELLRLGYKDTKICENFSTYCVDEVTAHSIFFNDFTTFDKLRTHDRIANNDYDYIIIVYNSEKKNKLEAGLTIAKIIFIAFLLWISAFIFLRDSDIYIVRRLEKNTKKVKDFYTNIDNNFYERNEILEIKDKEVTKIIFKFIKDYSIFIIKLFGLRSNY